MPATVPVRTALSIMFTVAELTPATFKLAAGSGRTSSIERWLTPVTSAIKKSYLKFCASSTAIPARRTSRTEPLKSEIEPDVKPAKLMLYNVGITISTSIVEESMS